MATNDSKLPAIPTQATFKESEPFVGLYTLYYRDPVRNNQVLTKNFRYNGDLHAARMRAEEHCTLMHFRFMFVNPLICDLHKEEKLYQNPHAFDTAAAAPAGEVAKK